jgi:hypothetical protein
MLLRKHVSLAIIIFAACSSNKDLSSDGSQDHVLTYGFDQPKLAPEKPYSVLPARKIPASSYRLLPSIDTVRMDWIYDSLPGKTAFIFKPLRDDFRQTIAVKRTNDWLLLDWTLFSLVAPAGLKMSFMDIDGKGSPELLLSYEQVADNGQKQSIHGGYTDEQGNSFYTSSVWSKARGFCIIDLDEISFLADNVMTGYEYYYETALLFKKNKVKEGRNVEISGITNRYRTAFRVWHNFEFFPGEGSIMVTLEKCELQKTLDSGKTYFNNSGESDEPDPETEMISPTCTPIYELGLYELKDGAFRLKM